MSRPSRQAAIVASARIKQYYKKGINQDTQKLLDQFPRTCQVLTTQKYCKKCIDEVALYPERKVDIINDMLQHLIAYPMILLVHPRFREVVNKKMDEFELFIQNESEFEKRVDDLEHTAHRVIHDIHVREKIDANLNSIRRIRSEYSLEKNISGLDALQQTIQNMRSMIEEFPSHPDYVSK